MSSTPWQESRAAPGPANAGSMAAGDAGNTDNNTVQGDAGTPGVLHGAYGWFNGNVTVNLDGSKW